MSNSWMKVLKMGKICAKLSNIIIPKHMGVKSCKIMFLKCQTNILNSNRLQLDYYNRPDPNMIQLLQTSQNTKTQILESGQL